MLLQLININKVTEEGWLATLQEQQEIYRPLGVQVTLAKRMASGSSRRMETIGLHFDIAYNAAPNAAAMDHRPTAAVAVPVADDLVSKLESLQNLHVSGALTDKEYAAAKAKLISGTG